MTDQQITISLETAQRVFDALVSSMDFGSGFLDSDDVKALRALAVAIGVDPNTATPSEFVSQYPHTFEGETDRVRIAHMVGALRQEVAIDHDGAPYTVNVINEGDLPDYAPCKVGTFNRKCLKPETDPIHR
jgi:hemin uptake protein HemP